MAYTYSETVNVACLVTLSTMKLAIFILLFLTFSMFFFCCFLFVCSFVFLCM